MNKDALQIPVYGHVPRSGNILLFDYAIICKKVKIYKYNNEISWIDQINSGWF